MQEPTPAAHATAAVAEEPAAAAAAPAAIVTATDAAAAAEASRLAKRVERFGRIAPVTETEAAEKMAKRREKFGLPEPVGARDVFIRSYCGGVQRGSCMYTVKRGGATCNVVLPVAEVSAPRSTPHAKRCGATCNVVPRKKKQVHGGRHRRQCREWCRGEGEGERRCIDPAIVLQ